MPLVIPRRYRHCGADRFRVWSQVCSVFSSGGLPAENVSCAYKWFSPFSEAIIEFFHHWFLTYSWILRLVLCSTRDNSLSVPAGSRWQGFQINYFGRKNNCQCAAATAASTLHAQLCYFLFLRSILALHEAESWPTSFLILRTPLLYLITFLFRSNLFSSLWAR